MVESRQVRRDSNSWVIALPATVRRHLRVGPKAVLYFYLWRSGEVVLSVKPERHAGRPEVTRLTHELEVARGVIEELERRNESRDRAMYGEGYAAGVMKTTEALTRPHGPSANRQRRRRLALSLPPADAHPSPPPPSSPVESAGEADTPGAEPPGVPTSS